MDFTAVESDVLPSRAYLTTPINRSQLLDTRTVREYTVGQRQLALVQPVLYALAFI